MSEQATSRTDGVMLFLSDEARQIHEGSYQVNYDGHDVQFDAKHNRILVSGQYILDYVVTLDGRAWFRPLRSNSWIESTATDELASEAVKRLQSNVDDARRIHALSVA